MASKKAEKRAAPTSDVPPRAKKKVTTVGTSCDDNLPMDEDSPPVDSSLEGAGIQGSCPDSDDGFQLVLGKNQKRRKGRRARPHPALLVVGAAGPPPPSAASVTVLFRPADPDDSLAKVSRMDLSRALGALSPPPVGVRHIRHGGLALDFASPAKLDAVLAVTVLAGLLVEASLPSRLPGCQGTIRGDFSDADEVKELYSVHVANPPLLSVRRIGSTQSWVLHFSCDLLPPSVSVFYNTHRVSAFFRHPVQCFRCRRFGHVAERCRGAVLCVRCGLSGHLQNACQARTPWCVNCGEAHPSSHKQCSHRVFALQVEKEMAREQVSRQTARHTVASRVASEPAPTRSYAAVVEGAPRPPLVPVAPPLVPVALPVVPTPRPVTREVATSTEVAPACVVASAVVQTDPPPPPPRSAKDKRSDQLARALRDLLYNGRMMDGTKFSQVNSILDSLIDHLVLP